MKHLTNIGKVLHTRKRARQRCLPELYKKITATKVLTETEVEKYISAYMDAEDEARKRNSTADALLSNLNQDYRTIFKTNYQKLMSRKIT